jgi:hypothetical protein
VGGGQELPARGAGRSLYSSEEGEGEEREREEGPVGGGVGFSRFSLASRGSLSLAGDRLAGGGLYSDDDEEAPSLLAHLRANTRGLSFSDD